MTSYDFGYTWVWTHGHLVPLEAVLHPAGSGSMAALAALAGGAVCRLALWAPLALHHSLVLRANVPMELPTASFLHAGAGRVLDLGAGSGRSTPDGAASPAGGAVTAVDIYSGYFGIDDNTPARIRANARVAGVEGRLDVVTADFRAMPFADSSYDAAVSAFVIDHLNRQGVTKALAEVSRVLRPGGQFLLIVLNVDGWVKVAYLLPHGHGYFSHSAALERWTSALEGAGSTSRRAGHRTGAPLRARGRLTGACHSRHHRCGYFFRTASRWATNFEQRFFRRLGAPDGFLGPRQASSSRPAASSASPRLS